MNAPEALEIRNAAQDSLRRLHFSHYPYLLCHETWLGSIYPQSQHPFIFLARDLNLKSRYIQSEQSVYLRSVPPGLLLGELGFLLSTPLEHLTRLYRSLAYFALFVEPKFQTILPLDAVQKQEAARFSSRFKRDGALYQNSLKSVAPLIKKTSRLVFGTKLSEGNAAACESFGLYILTILISNEVTPSFLDLVSLRTDKAHASFRQNDFELSSKTKLAVVSVLLKYLVDAGLATE